MEMEVRWRLFAREILSMPVDGKRRFVFGRPLRPVKGLRLFGVVIRKSRPNSIESTVGGHETLQGQLPPTGGGSVETMDGDFGLLAVDDGTGVVEVRMALQLWEPVVLGDQVDVVGTLEAVPNACSPSPGALGRRRLRAEGCHVEADPNVAILRALECINLYKTCYSSRAWSPSSVPLLPKRPDPFGKGSEARNDNRFAATAERNASTHPHPHLEDNKGPSVRDCDGPASGNVAPDVDLHTLEERLLETIGASAGRGGATAGDIHSLLRMPQGDPGVASVLAQMQLDGAIYLAGDRYMPL